MTSCAEARPRLELRDALLLVVRWSHAVAATLLVGGSGFHLLVVVPVFGRLGVEPARLRAALDPRFKDLLDLSLVVFLISGGLLTFERLSSGAASVPYVATLGLKIILSLVLYRWAYQVRRGAGWEGREARLFVGAGFVVVFLASLLKSMYESGLRP